MVYYLGRLIFKTHGGHLHNSRLCLLGDGVTVAQHCPHLQHLAARKGIHIVDALAHNLPYGLFLSTSIYGELAQ
jgi:hypothetical protein